MIKITGQERYNTERSIWEETEVEELSDDMQMKNIKAATSSDKIVTSNNTFINNFIINYRVTKLVSVYHTDY
jgi:hypothetical protein